jgi:hypothetical protein
VRFADYRQYEQVRIEASNAVMGLLAGAQMAAHMLQLTEESDRPLPEMFPQIPADKLAVVLARPASTSALHTWSPRNDVLMPSSKRLNSTTSASARIRYA